MSVLAWSLLALGVALVAYGLIRSLVPETAKESLEAMTWRSRRTRGAVLFFMGSALIISATVLLLQPG